MFLKQEMKFRPVIYITYIYLISFLKNLAFSARVQTIPLAKEHLQLGWSPVELYWVDLRGNILLFVCSESFESKLVKLEWYFLMIVDPLYLIKKYMNDINQAGSS